MMQKLDNNLREGKSSTDLARKVDDALKSETAHFFNRVTHMNIRKLQPLVQRCEMEVGTIVRECQEKIRSKSSTVVASTTSQAAVVGPLELELEELRLEEDYCRNWMQHEGFHLSEAFKSQQLKLDREWQGYSHQLIDAIQLKKNDLLGQRPASPQRSGTSAEVDSDSNNQFHHPEKQKTLFNTAPVIQPNLNTTELKKERGGRGGTKAAGSAVKAVRSGKEEAQLQLEVRTVY